VLLVLFAFAPNLRMNLGMVVGIHMVLLLIKLLVMCCCCDFACALPAPYTV
jgi:hypothetical protein